MVKLHVSGALLFTLSKIRSVETSYLRGVGRITQKDGLRNVDLGDQCGVEGHVLRSIRRNTLRWFGHIEKMDDERLTKKVYESEGEVQGERGRGQPRMR